MNELIKITNEPLTMSSREIAELTEKRHDNVRRTIETLAERGVIELPQIEEVKNHLGQAVQEYRLFKRDSYVVVAQLSPEFTARLVDRWQELEEQVKQTSLNPANLSRMQLIQIAMEAEQERQALESKVNELEPKANALDAISAGPDALTMTQASKVLGIKRTVLIAHLHATGWVYRQNGSWVAYDQYIKNGCLLYKEAVYTDEKTEQKTIRPYCHITPKGLSRLAMAFGVAINDALLEGAA